MLSYLKHIVLLILVNSILSSQASEFIPADNSNYYYSGRIDFSNPLTPSFAYSGVRIRTVFEGTSVAAIFETSSAEQYFYYIIDEDDPVKFEVDNRTNTYPLSSGLADSLHRLEIVRITEGFTGITEFHGLLLDDGKDIDSPQINETGKIEFIGNSITCGYGVEAASAYDSFDPVTENFSLSYAGLTAKSFDAEYHAICRSGIGMFRNYGGPQSGSSSSMYNIYHGIFSEQPELAEWDFSHFQPEVITINLGTNDYSEAGVDSELFKAQYLKFLDTLRLKYSPETKIIVLAGPMNNSELLLADLHAVVDSHKVKGYQHTYFFEMSAQGDLGFGADWHPSIEQAKLNATELISFIEEITGWESTAVSLPAAPDNLSAASITSTSILLHWNDNSINELGFIIEQKLNGGSFLEIDTVDKNITSLRIDKLLPAANYVYRIKAYNAVGNSLYSGENGAITNGKSGYAYVQDTTNQGIVSLEAEHYYDRLNIETHRWDPNTLVPDYSGESAMHALPDMGSTVDVQNLMLSPRMDYLIDFKKTGTHYLWLRAYHSNTSNDSFHAGLDGKTSNNSVDIYSIGPAYAWNWVNTANAGRTILEVDSIGLHTLNLWMNEDGAAVDKIIITSDADYLPFTNFDKGEPESVQENYFIIPPVALAGPDTLIYDQDRDGAENIVLDASGSYDPDGEITMYNWNAADTILAMGANPVLSLPLGMHTLILRVYDSDSAYHADTLRIIISPLPNAAPIANAGEDIVITEGELVILDASASTDADGVIETYAWSHNSNLISSEPIDTINLDRGEYEIILEISDNNGALGSDTLFIVVNPPQNKAPMAIAGPDQEIIEGGTITLDASGSIDVDGYIASYYWSIADTGLSADQIVTVLLPVGEHSIVLMVSDNEGYTAYDTLLITVHKNPLPAPPSNLMATGISDTTILLSWIDNSDNESNFEVERKVGTENFRLIDIVEANTDSYLDNGLEAATEYTYRLRASNQFGYTQYCEEHSASTSSNTILLSKTDPLIKVFPNPAYDFFTIQAPADATLLIFSLEGNLILHSTIEPSGFSNFDFSAVGSGMYQIKLISEGQIVILPLLIF